MRMTTSTMLGYDDLPALLVRLTGDEKHDWAALSTLDVLWVLYDRVLGDDDRFLLSKGHGPTAFYAVLAAKGILPLDLLDGFGGFDSPLGHHPDRVLVPGVEIGSGSLGHGLPIAVGAALGARLQGAPWRTFVLTGDGELQEGSNWEAAMSAAHFELDGLTVIVDRNGLQQGARTEETVALEPLADRWRSFGFAVAEVDGHDIPALIALFDRLPLASRQPTCIIAKTMKGRGVSFIQDRAEWHHRIPTATELAEALAELEDEA